MKFLNDLKEKFYYANDCKSMYFDYGFYHKPNRASNFLKLFCDNGKKDVKARQPKINFKKFGASILILPSLAGNDASHHLYPIVPKSKV